MRTREGKLKYICHWSYCSKREYEKFMKDVVSFEKQLNKDGVHVIKFWFSINVSDVVDP